MRAREFIPEDANVINIHITIPNGGAPVISAAPQTDEEPEVDVMVSPLQQELELAKAHFGKTSGILPKIMADNGALSDQTDEEPRDDPSRDY